MILSINEKLVSPSIQGVCDFDVGNRFDNLLLRTPLPFMDACLARFLRHPSNVFVRKVVKCIVLQSSTISDPFAVMTSLALSLFAPKMKLSVTTSHLTLSKSKVDSEDSLRATLVLIISKAPGLQVDQEVSRQQHRWQSSRDFVLLLFFSIQIHPHLRSCII